MRRISLVLVLGLLATSTALSGERQQERLDRGLVARPIAGGKVYLSWRLLESDQADVGFVVSRHAEGTADVKLTAEPIRKTTDFVDNDPPDQPVTYTLTTIPGDKPAGSVKLEHPRSAEKLGPFKTIKLDPKATFQKVGIADLDGDGAYDFIIKSPDENVDPYVQYWKKSPGTFTLEAVRSDGKSLWKHDLGWSIEQGIWYSPYVVFDLDGDGKAEVALKTGEGDPRDAEGKVMTGPEWLTILDGATGKQITQTAWPDRQPFLDAHPKPLDAYNYASRNFLGVAYLDGVHPHLIVERGTYSVMFVRAYRLEKNELKLVWSWDNTKLGREYRGQGAHGMHAADVDGDGRDELILGSLVLDDDGKPLWTTGMGHPDHAYVGDIDPTRPGLEIYYGMESAQKKNGMCLADARTGKILWGFDKPTRHVHGQGLCSDIDPKHPGSECYSADTDPKKDFAFARLYSAKGEVLSDENLGGFAPHAVYWNADKQREVIMKRRVTSFPDRQQLGPRIEGNVIAVADILGDWREEVITTVPGELRIYMTDIPAADRRVCLMRDPIYRIDVAHAAGAYFQVPMLSFDLATAAGR